MLKRMNYKKSFDVVTKVYPILVKLFYMILKIEGLEGYEHYATSVNSFLSQSYDPWFDL